MLRVVLLVSLCIVMGFAAFPAWAQDKQDDEYLTAWRVADGIRAAMWKLDDSTDPIAQKLSECEANHSDTIGMNECLDAAYDAYEKALAALEKKKGQKEECSGTICGIISRANQISKLRERIAEESFERGGGQE